MTPITLEDVGMKDVFGLNEDSGCTALAAMTALHSYDRTYMVTARPREVTITRFSRTEATQGTHFLVVAFCLAM